MPNPYPPDFYSYGSGSRLEEFLFLKCDISQKIMCSKFRKFVLRKRTFTGPDFSEIAGSGNITF
jgi:hypothetical protein